MDPRLPLPPLGEDHSHQGPWSSLRPMEKLSPSYDDLELGTGADNVTLCTLTVTPRILMEVKARENEPADHAKVR